MKNRKLPLPAFEFWRAGPRDWRWHLRAGNSEIVAQGEGYTSKAKCEWGVASVILSALMASKKCNVRRIEK